MAVSQEIVSKLLSALSNPLRREILLNLSEKGEQSFTDLMSNLNMDTGKLSFHLRGLRVFLEQTPTGKYKLSKLGENALRLIRDIEAWAVEADITEKPQGLPIANLTKRTLAFLIDFSIAFTVFMLSAVVTDLFSVLTGGRFGLDINIILFLILFWTYFTLLEGFAGQSIGKRIGGLKVVRVDGKKMFYDHAAVRNFGKCFLLPIDILVGFRLKDERFRRYFDKFAGTMVIDLRF